MSHINLEEAIKYAEEIVEDEERNAGWFYDKEKSCYKKKCINCDEKQLAEWLKELKQLRERAEWIPVSERLPKVADCYAVTQKIGSDLIVSACYFDGIKTWHNDNWINHERNYLTDIVAWMPLPEPYEPQESEE